MSNTAVGQIYKSIIDQVLDSARPDFEEHAVGIDVLHALQKHWQQRLSDEHRAVFPWDPQPESVKSPPTVPSNAVKHEPNPQPAQHSVPQNAYRPTPLIKQEPNQENGHQATSQASYSSGLNQNVAAQRAAQLLHSRYGAQAAGSINALHAANMNMTNSPYSNVPHNMPSAAYQQQRAQPSKSDTAIPSQHQQLPQIQTNQAGHPPAHARTPVDSGEPPAKRIKQEKAPNGFANSQTDGAGDFEPTAPMGKMVYSAGMLRAENDALMQRLEAGGLLLPLDERRPNRPVASSSKLEPAPIESAQLDGPSDSPASSDKKEEDDDDLINSDLDDPDEMGAEGMQPDYEGDVILCLFDKVQRVKNKWKCVLKDGVVTVGGKDYVFHKAQGEFEW